MTASTITANQGGFLTAKATLLKSVFINFLTKLIPLILGFTSVPFILSQLGNERLGILTLVWALIGYSTIMDMGLGRALTQHVATKIGQNDTESLPITIFTALVSVFGLGCLATLILWFLTPVVVNNLNVSSANYAETLWSVRLLALSLPFFIGNIMAMGIFEAFQKFAFLNKLNWPIVIANFIAPFFILPYWNNLPALVLAVLISRLLVFFCLIINLPSVIPNFYQKMDYRFNHIKPLLGYSKWIALNTGFETAGNLLDRFFVAAMMNASMVAFISTPAFAMARFSGFITSAVNVFFPAFSIEFVQNPVRCRKMYLKTFVTMVIGMLIPFGLVAVFSKLFLTLWLGAAFAGQAYTCFSLLAVAFYIKAVGVFVQSFLDASSNMKTTSLINIISFPLLLGLFYVFIRQYGLIGAPMALAIRELICLVAKIYYAEKYFNLRLATV